MLAIFAVAGLQAAERGAAVRLASDGKAASAIVVPAGASSDTLRAAGECADGLRRITGADFTVTPGPANGIVVGTAEEWGVPFPRDVSLSPVLQRDDYIIRTEGGKLWLLGQSPVGVRNAVWDLFHRLGMRQFFPGSKWEVWPRTPKLEFGADLVVRPAFYARQLRRGDGWPETEADYDRWLIRNRMMSGFVLNTSHVYDSFIASYPAFFKAHPEAITNNGGDARVKQGVGRLQTKLDVTVPGVLELLAADALAQLKADPTLDSIRMDPSDGGGWRTDSPLGSPSNQALTAANHVARAIKPTHPGLKVGMYAYGWHSPPPTIKVEPNVIVSVATAFLRDGHTVESLLKGWHERGAEMGIREYLSCWPWDYDLPGLSHAADLPYVRNGLVRFHALGARYWTSTTSNGWGPHGLGFYYASRVLWSLDRAESVAEIKRDFFEKAFGPVSAAMQTFFEKYILTEGHPLLSEDLVGRMYRGLRETLDHPQPEDVRARVFELVRYVRFVDLMFNYRSSRGDARPVAFLELARFAYRTRDSQIANSWGAVFRDREIDAKAPRIAEALKQFAAEPLLSDNDLEALLAARIRETRINDFEPRSFSSDLLPLPATETDQRFRAAEFFV